MDTKVVLPDELGIKSQGSEFKEPEIDPEIRSFILELAELTRKTGIAIGGCMCCDSPYTFKLSAISSEDGYTSDFGGDCINWLSRGDYTWDRDKDTIVK